MPGLIPQDFIDNVISRSNIVDVINDRVHLKKTGKNYTACCPFHKEKTPSFSVNIDKQFYYCFGCGAGGNVLSFIMDHDRIDFPSAIESLAAPLGLEIPHVNKPNSSSLHRTNYTPLYDTLNAATQFYCQSLKLHPQRSIATNYLKSRGLSGEIARDFKLGFAAPGWNNLQTQLNNDSLQKQHMLTTGLLVEHIDTKKTYDRFRDRVMFPIRDSRGRVIAFGGRVLDDSKPKYLNSPESPIFHKSQELYGLYEARQFNRNIQEIIVVEGYMDVIALAQQGIRNAVATLGTATSSEHIKKIFRIAPNILFCFDGDAAGQKAARKALEETLPHLKDDQKVRFLILPSGEDPDSLVRREGADTFQSRIQKEAHPLTEYFFQQISIEANLDSLEGKAHFASLATPLIETIAGANLKTLMLTHLNKITGLSFKDKSKATHQHNVSIPIKRSYSTEKNKQQHKTQIDSPIIMALRALLLYPALAQKIESIDIFSSDENIYVQLMLSLISTLQKKPTLNTLQLIARWHGTKQGKLLQQLAEKEWLISQENLEQHFFDTIFFLRKHYHQKKLDLLLIKSNKNQLTDEEKQQLRTLLGKRNLH
ncbi:UNVERIFIED_CONTAM: hypothetical protein GTU68_036760 [Idotea baltica]|nr:hypothetical protein [Idotea baltica]